MDQYHFNLLNEHASTIQDNIVRNRIGKRALVGTHGDPKGKDIVS